MTIFHYVISPETAEAMGNDLPDGSVVIEQMPTFDSESTVSDAQFLDGLSRMVKKMKPAKFKEVSVIDHALANGLPITRFGAIGDPEEFGVLAFGTSTGNEPLKSNQGERYEH